MKRRIEKTNRNHRMIRENRRNFRNRRMMKEYLSASKNFDDNAIILSNVRDNKIDDDDVVVYYFSVDKDHDFYVIDYDIRISDYDEDEVKQNIVEAVSDYVWNNIDEFNVLTGDDFTEEEWEEYNEDGVGDIANYRILWTSDDEPILCDEIYCSGYVDENDIADDDVVEQVKRKYKRMNRLKESHQFRRVQKMLKESNDIDKEQVIKITDEMKEKYRELYENKWDEVIYPAKKLNWWEADKYAFENDGLLPTQKEMEDIWKMFGYWDDSRNLHYAWTAENDGRHARVSKNRPFDHSEVDSKSEKHYFFYLR